MKKEYLKIQQKLKEQKGSITSFTLLSMMFFVIVLVGLYVSVNYKIQKQESEINKIQKNYEQEDIDKLYDEAYGKYLNSGTSAVEVYENTSLIATVARKETNTMKTVYTNSEQLTIKVSSENAEDKFVYSLSKEGEKIDIQDGQFIVTVPQNGVTAYIWTKGTDGKYGDYYIAIDIRIKFSTAYGKIDVIWLDTGNNVKSSPNAPNLGDMTAIKWENSTEQNTTSSDTSWYSYKAKTGTGDNTESRWANAKNADGSYFVWIPRFAYRITYYASQSSTIETGYSDGQGMRDLYGNIISELDSGIKTVTSNGKSYIVHPAFVNEYSDDGDNTNDFTNGGWDSDLSGFWVAKYEMSGESSSDSGITWVANGAPGNVTTNSKTSTTLRAVSKPGVQSWRKIIIGNCYTNSYDYDRNKESHLMKNSEWGAVAYLTHSQYGRNGEEITINSDSGYYTGGSNGSTALTNVKQSTTGNETGIFDLSGGVWEYTAAYDSKSTSSHLATYGSSFASTNGYSTKYATAYENGTDTNSGETGRKVCKMGDAIKEIRKENNRSWFDDFSDFVFSKITFFRRGGTIDNGNGAGVFAASVHGGIDDAIHGFRTVLSF